MSCKRLILCFVSTILYSTAEGMYYGIQCTTGVCTEDRGYIIYNSKNLTEFTTAPQFKWKLETTDWQFKTFILHLKSIQIANKNTPWMEITQGGYAYSPKTYIKGNEDRLLVFEDTRDIIITLLHESNIQFRLNYFMDCQVKKGSNVTIKQSRPKLTSRTHSTSSNPSNVQRILNNYYLPFGNYWSKTQKMPAQNIISKSRSKCWLIIPAIEEEEPIMPLELFYLLYGRQPASIPTQTKLKPEKVVETYLTVQNMQLNNNTFLNIGDLLAGNELMSLNGESNIEITTLKKNNQSALDIYNQPFYSAVLIDLNCKYDRECTESDFQIAANALQQSDINCIKEQQKCKFNIGENKNYSCTPPTESPLHLMLNTTVQQMQTPECPAFNYISKHIFQTIKTSKTSNDSRTFTINENCFHFDAYCSGEQCIKFEAEGCHLMCFQVKHHMRLCTYFNSLFT